MQRLRATAHLARIVYEEDAAAGIMARIGIHNKAEAVNLGAGREISIKDLPHTIAWLLGFGGEIRRDTIKFNGQPRGAGIWFPGANGV